MPHGNPDIPPFLVLQHIECEPPGAYGDELDALGLARVAVELDRGETLPASPTEFAGVIVMGGPMGAYEVDEHPWLVDEIAFLEAALADDVPIWGVCLGAQLLAAALGATVRPGAEPEVGIRPVTVTEAGAADPVFAAAPASFAALHWHGDTFDLPDGATRLAESEAYREQAFRHGRSLALQFHLEVSTELASEWAAIPAYARSLEEAVGAGALPELLDGVAETAPAATALGRRLFASWLAEVPALGPAARSSAGQGAA